MTLAILPRTPGKGDREMKVYSLAGTGKWYKQGQAALYPHVGPDSLHVQFDGEGGNRGYGYAETFSVPSDVTAFIANAEKGLESKAGTSRMYVEVQARPRPGVIHFQVKSFNLKGNRAYGKAFDVPKAAAPGLWEFLALNLI